MARARAFARSLAAVGLGLLLACLVAAGAFGIQTTLRRASRADRLAARELAVLERLRTVRSLETISSSRLRAVCRQSAPGRAHVDLSDGRRLLVSTTHARSLAGPKEPSLELAAEADLAGCPGLLADELSRRLEANRPILAGGARVRGRAAFKLLLGRGWPVVELLVARRDLAPVGVRFVSRSVRGRSVLLGLGGRVARRSHRLVLGGDER